MLLRPRKVREKLVKTTVLITPTSRDSVFFIWLQAFLPTLSPSYLEYFESPESHCTSCSSPQLLRIMYQYASDVSVGSWCNSERSRNVQDYPSSILSRGCSPLEPLQTNRSYSPRTSRSAMRISSRTHQEIGSISARKLLQDTKKPSLTSMLSENLGRFWLWQT